MRSMVQVLLAGDGRSASLRWVCRGGPVAGSAVRVRETCGGSATKGLGPLKPYGRSGWAGLWGGGAVEAVHWQYVPDESFGGPWRP